MSDRTPVTDPPPKKARWSQVLAAMTVAALALLGLSFAAYLVALIIKLTINVVSSF